MPFQSPSKPQATISSYFSQSPAPKKRTQREAIDLTIDSDDEHASPQHKRVKRANIEPSSRHASLTTGSGARHAAPAVATTEPPALSQRWALGASAEPDMLEPTRAEEILRRHEAFKRKLLGPDNPLDRRQKNLADASNVEELMALEREAAVAHELREEEESSSATSSDLKKGSSANKQNAKRDEDESVDPKFEVLLQSFSNKGKGKASNATGTKKGKKQVEEIGPSGETWTPLEKQVLQLKKDNPGTLLMVMVGYKYRFYGDDAKIASKELGIVCYPYRNFLSASIPVQRRDFHLKRLLAQGYKVGVVEQTETAALKKVGDTRSALFTRGLTHLYTATTFVDELDSEDLSQEGTSPPLVCVVEQLGGGSGVDERVTVGFVAVSPGTGDVVWDEFNDGHMRSELETRLAHTRPSELLLPSKKLSVYSEKILSHFIAEAPGSHRARIERFDRQMNYNEAYEALTRFYSKSRSDDDTTSKENSRSGVVADTVNSDTFMSTLSTFPKLTTIALAHAVGYLTSFSLSGALLNIRFFSPFSTRTNMLLTGNTLANLEIYTNQTDGTTKGSLIWLLDKTATKFGARLLRSWIGRPLIDKQALQARVNAVEEICTSVSGRIAMLRNLLKGLPDLARGLCRIQYGQATPQELVTVLRAFNRVGTTFAPFATPEAVGFKSPVLNEIVYALPKLRGPVRDLLNIIDEAKALSGNKEDMWADEGRVPKIEELMSLVKVVEVELREELSAIRKTVRQPGLQYTTWLNEEYIIEIRKEHDRLIPPDWIIVSSTRVLRRYHTPRVKAKVDERARLKESLVAEANQAYAAFLSEIAIKHYTLLRDAVQKLATADCLMSLALVSLQSGYAKPQFVEDEDVFEITDGRHPLLEQLRSDPYVPNSSTMGGERPRSAIVTGPNMGGKSSCVRQIALIAIMAQIGTYVPAEAVRLSILDGVFTRMGAYDELARGRSTFMVEMTETSEILQAATKNSLVILDELGRGTSTYDGMSIAYAVLQYLVENVKCKTLFITHYPLVAAELERKFPDCLQNLHMGFTEYERLDRTREITFLYKLTTGIASGSFGVECGRLAELPEKVLEEASKRSEEMQRQVEERNRRVKMRRALGLLQQCLSGQSSSSTLSLLDGLRNLVV